MPSFCALCGVFRRGFRPSTTGLYALSRGFIGSGFRPRTTCYFSLFGQRKLTKRKAARLPRPAGPLRFSPESALAYAPSWREGEDMPSLACPLRASPDSGCDARRGRRGVRQRVKIKIQNPCARSAHLHRDAARRAAFDFQTPLSRRATQPGAEQPAGGAPWMARISPSAHGRAVGETRPGRVAQGTAIAARHRGGLFFR
jgi:hypothetical protein